MGVYYPNYSSLRYKHEQWSGLKSTKYYIYFHQC